VSKKTWAAMGTVLCLLVFGTVATAIPLCDYSSPRTSLSDLNISFSYQYHQDPYGLTDRNIDEGQLHIDYTRHFDSPNFGYDAAVANDMNISALSVSSFAMSGQGNVKWYFNPEAEYFALAGGTAKSASSYKSLGLFVKLGLGYGRFTDVTPLAKAMEIDDYLLSHGSITRHLEAIDLQSIAHEIDNINTYASVADLLSALREIIESSGVAKPSGLDALDIYEMMQIVQDNSHPRYCGGSFSLGLGYEILNPQNEPRNVLATAAFNYAFTTTPLVQFLVQGTFSGAYDFLQTNQMSLQASYDYMISRIVDIAASYSFSRETYSGTPTDEHDISLNVTFTPISAANITLSMHFVHKPYYLKWSQDISFQIGMKLL
jgi:hypothetical protein